MKNYTFKDYIREEEENDVESNVTKNQLFNYNIFKSRLIPKIEDVLKGTHEYNNVPGHIYIEVLDIMQLIKQILVDTLEKDNVNDIVDGELLKTLSNNLNDAFKIMYPNASLSELTNTIKKEIILRIRKFGVSDVLSRLDREDISMEAKDDFGIIMSRIFDNDFRKEKGVEQNTLTLVKHWDDKIKITGETLSAKVRNRMMLKNKLFDRIVNTLDENDMVVDDELENDESENQTDNMGDKDIDVKKNDDIDDKRKPFNMINHLRNKL